MSTLVVVKAGGGLLALPGALDALTEALPRAAAAAPLLVVPGGGPFADAVREAQRAHGFDAHAAHWMAIHAMDQFAHLLAARVPGGEVLDDPAGLPALHARRRVPILAPSRWMRAADVLPHTWDVTSDSIAAFVAGALDARRLVLVKPAGGPVAALVDPWFRHVVPLGLDVRIVPAGALASLADAVVA